MKVKRHNFDKFNRIFDSMDKIKLDCHGGYPAVVDTTIYGFFIRADADENGEVSVNIWTLSQMKQWLKDLVQYLKDNPGEEERMAVWETRPKPLNG